MKNNGLLFGILSLVLAALIFIFASGSRRIYSGVFFMILGIAMIATSRKRAKPDGD